jgi:serine/threonine protein kinase
MMSGRPNLPEVVGSGFTDAGQPYIVSKLYRHGTLRERVRTGGTLTPGEIDRAGHQLATALEVLHEQGVVHGDVKPENVFIDDDDALVLGDLGTAWTRGRSGLFAGPAVTPAYAAPEVWLGHAPTPASDLYSLGLTLLFAATGETPQPGSPPDESLVVDAFGSDVVAPLLEIDPRKRLRTALEAAERFASRLRPRGAVGDAELLPPPTWTTRSR